MLNVLSEIAKANVAGAPVKFKWSDEIASQMDDTENDRLYVAIDAANFRAKMAVAALLAEWSVRRFQGLLDIDDALLRIEASWAAVVDPLYPKGLEHEPAVDDDAEPVRGAFECAMTYLGDTVKAYVDGWIYLAEPVVKQATLARHVLPDKKAFDAWLSDTLRKTAKAFPRKGDYNEEREFYDASSEPLVPREFFEPGFAGGPATTRAAIAAFLAQLDPARNPYLRTAKELAKAGFKSKPYTI